MGNEIIRPAKIEDAEGIAKVHIETWQYAYKGQLPQKMLDELSIEKRLEVWKEQLINPKPETFNFVALVDGVLAGWVTGGITREDDVSEEVGELYGIYVHPDYIGKGLGSKLINKLLDTLKVEGYKKATLWVLTSNEKSRKWYESKGWKVDGKIKIDKREGYDLHETRYTTDLT